MSHDILSDIFTEPSHFVIGSFSLSTDRIGALFETFVYIQLSNTLKSQDRKFRLSNYRTSNDAEVDFILELDNETYAIELIGPRGLLKNYDYALPWAGSGYR